MSQTTLFGDCIKSQSFTVYHDESGGYGNTKWVYTGLFWINENYIPEIYKDLQEIRQGENYYGEIHFKNFPKSFGGEYGGKTRVAKEWFNLWKNKWSRKSYFNVLAVNTNHPRYENDRFSKEFHAYNLFTLLAIKSGVPWFFPNYSEIHLNICSDEKTRRPEGAIPDGTNNDNFEEYLKWQVGIMDVKGPIVNISEDVKCISCPKKGPYAPEHEFLQLTDLLLGSVTTAVEAKANRKTKIWFGKQMAKIMEDIRLEPWNQKFKLHRRFSVSYFPDEFGKIYNDEPMDILNLSDKNQTTLF
ncbi:hypothetical protein ACSAZK_03095 [Methanosarcina sp. Mfa9]|uniref:hypothetical protein n=1 Tax=Methanosarcina sp. Mfa9 TaxID=3439063 RepID=UPI003F85CDA4